MSARSILGVLAACIVLSTGIGFAFGAASQPDSATAAKGSKTLKQIKRGIRALDNDIQALGNQVAADIKALVNDVADVQSSSGLVGLATTNIESDTKTICRALDTLC